MAFVDDTGLQIKTIEEMLDELATEQRAEIASTLNTAADSPIGQLNGIVAAQLREVWEVAQVAYNGFNPDAAEGFLLDKLCAITGTVRLAATKGTVTCTCNLDSGTTLSAGSSYANVSGESSNRWTPVEDFTAPSTGNHEIEFESEFTGTDAAANSGTITVINTAVTGWNSVTNAADAVPGTDTETDAALRVRRVEELTIAGTGTVDAIRADVLSDVDVLQVDVFENTSDITDANGLPPKSIEVLVYDGDPAALTDDEIAQLIWDTKPAGIRTVGQESGTATDGNGDSQTVYFSRPSPVELYLDIDIDVDSTTGYAGETALKEALVALNDSDFRQGRDVIINKLIQVCLSFDGVIDVTDLKTDTSATPTNTANYVIGPRELARFDTGRITITENSITRP